MMEMMTVKNICVYMVFLMLHIYNKKPYEFCTKKTCHVQQKFNNLKIREIRDKIGAHSSEFEVRKHKTSKKEFESYIPIRYSLVGHKIVYVNNENIAEDIYVDLIECLNEHLILIIDLLDKINEKSIMTFYKDNHLKQRELFDRLVNLRNQNTNPD